MEREKIIETLSDWNFWFKEVETGIKRGGYIDRELKIIKSKEIGIISGIRRSGKSTILLQLAKELIKNKGVNPKNILIINFEDYRWEEYSLDLLSEIWKTYNENIHEKGEIYLFLDEIHNIKGWERFVRTLYDLKDINIFATGSSSKLLSKEYATLLSGRYIPLFIYPLSFEEYLFFNKLDIKNSIELLARKDELLKHLNNYMKMGGFPKYVLVKDRELLSSYFETIILKDIVERYKVKEIGNLRKLAVFYLTNIANRITYNSIKKFLHLPLNSIERYSYYFEQVFLIYFVPCFSYSLKSQEKLPRKIYSADNGLAEVLGFRFMENYGKFMENLVFIELKRRFLKEEIYYYLKDNFEVDFVIKQGLKIKQLIQVCYSLEDEKTKKREIISLIKAGKELKCRDLLVLTWDYKGIETSEGCRIKYMPLWQWLLLLG